VSWEVKKYPGAQLERRFEAWVHDPKYPSQLKEGTRWMMTGIEEKQNFGARQRRGGRRGNPSA
jgi:hypothetical protein